MTETGTQATDANARFLAELDSRLEHIGRRLDRLAQTLASAQEDAASPTPEGARAEDATAGHLVFVPTPTGYEIVAREGPPPSVGETVALEGRGSLLVMKVAPSPFPGDRRPCVYLQLT